jgi:hypothetical protein
MVSLFVVVVVVVDVVVVISKVVLNVVTERNLLTVNSS